MRTTASDLEFLYRHDIRGYDMRANMNSAVTCASTTCHTFALRMNKTCM